jgi:predicted secreted protein
VELEAADSAGAFTLRIGERVVIRLAESPGTGYRWTAADLDETRISLEDSEFSQAARGDVGGAGIRTLTLRARRRGVVTVTLENRRAWAGSGAPVGQFQATFTIEDKGEA